MKEKIKIHVNHLFETAPNTRKVTDLKDELIANLEDKYEDLIKNGKEEQQAYEEVIAGIGDIEELVSTIKEETPIKTQNTEEKRKKNAFMVSLAVGLYILSLISGVILSEIGAPDFLAGISFLTIAGIATCLLIYHFMSQPNYVKKEDTIVEEFKEWNLNKSKNKEIKSAVISILWLLIVAIYFIISFAFNAWAYSWIIYLIGAALTNIITLYFKIKE